MFGYAEKKLDYHFLLSVPKLQNISLSVSKWRLYVMDWRLIKKKICVSLNIVVHYFL